jgi:hypothetical protein
MPVGWVTRHCRSQLDGILGGRGQIERPYHRKQRPPTPDTDRFIQERSDKSTLLELSP